MRMLKVTGGLEMVRGRRDISEKGTYCLCWGVTQIYTETVWNPVYDETFTFVLLVFNLKKSLLCHQG